MIEKGHDFICEVHAGGKFRLGDKPGDAKAPIYMNADLKGKYDNPYQERLARTQSVPTNY